MDRVAIVHDNFLTRVAAGDFPTGAATATTMPPADAVALFRAQCLSRALDRSSRDMQKQGIGFYTIGSSGHEGMAAVAAALRPDDMAFLHYRDAAFQIARAAQIPGQNPTWDMLLSFACAADDPVSGGRHKVLGGLNLMIPPQTSTIASHLPKSLGAAYSIGAARRLRPEHARLADDGLVICSFGDASLNHSTAQGAINAACWAAVQSTPLPLLMVCEDNGIGISTKTPRGWVENSIAHRPGMKYFACNGLDLFETFATTQQAAAYIRHHQKPAFLHVKTVRLYGHAGPDVATSYLDVAEVERDEANDPLLHSARLLTANHILEPGEVLEIYTETCARVTRIAGEIAAKPPLKSAADVMASIIPPCRENAPTNGPTEPARADAFGRDLAMMRTPQPMSKLINWALRDLMLSHGEIALMGEDVGLKGGVYGVTQKLQEKFGADRVIDTLLDEQSILGLAIGMAHNGFIPMPEIQFLAYLHNAEDQIRGEAATLPFFSQGQFTNPMVLRIAGLGYQKGFGGHFHNDNSLAVLRDIPGIIIACPSNGADAAKMLRECVRLARDEQRVVVFVEPIALYPMRDLEPGDGAWMQHYPAPDEAAPLGTVSTHGDGRDLAIVTYGNGCYLAHQAMADLAAAGVAARVVDYRWIAPLPIDAIRTAIADCHRILIVDECRKTGGQADTLLAQLSGDKPIGCLAAEDSFIATGRAFGATLPSRDGIVRAAKSLMDAKQ